MKNLMRFKRFEAIDVPIPPNQGPQGVSIADMSPDTVDNGEWFTMEQVIESDRLVQREEVQHVKMYRGEEGFMTDQEYVQSGFVGVTKGTYDGIRSNGGCYQSGLYTEDQNLGYAVIRLHKKLNEIPGFSPHDGAYICRKHEVVGPNGVIEEVWIVTFVFFGETPDIEMSDLNRAQRGLTRIGRDKLQTPRFNPAPMRRNRMDRGYDDYMGN